MSEEADEKSVSEHEQLDWEGLRKLSLVPGGFGEARIHVWPRLLLRIPSQHGMYANGTSSMAGLNSNKTSHLESKPSMSDSNHQDERQIQLDTDRSFVLYPVGETISPDNTKNRETLQTELHQLLLAVFRRRPKLSYFQGYHDIISVLYLTLPADLQLDCAEKLSLHRVRDSMGTTLEPVLGLLRILRNILRQADPPLASLLERNSTLPYYALSNLLTLFSHDMPSLPLIQHVFDFLLCRPPIAAVYLAAALVLSRREEVERLNQEGEEGMVHSLLSGIPDLLDDVSLVQDDASGAMHIPNDVSVSNSDGPPLNDLIVNDDVYEPLDRINDQSDTTIDSSCELASVSGTTLLENNSNFLQEKQEDGDNLPDSSESRLKSSPRAQGPAIENDIRTAEEDGQPRTRPITPPPSVFPHRPKITLTSLLTHADELFELYPPTHLSISLSSIMGPQSVLFTWSEKLSEMPEDDEAESMVTLPELIVRPYIELGPYNKEAEEESGPGKKRSKLCGAPRFGWIAVERRTLIAGAVVVLSIGLAVYGIRTRSTVTQGGIHYGKRMRTWIGKALEGASN